MAFGSYDRHAATDDTDLPGIREQNLAKLLKLSGIPWATLTLIVVLAVIYGTEIGFSPQNSPDVQRLVQWGADNNQLVIQHHQYWRLIASVFLHANQDHLAGNCIALALAGLSLESIVGPFWLVVIFLGSAMGGDILSLQYDPANTVSVGASGGIMGLFAFLLFAELRDDNSDRMNRLIYFSGRLLIWNMIPSGQVDTAAHIGGALTGTALFMIVSAWWDDNDDAPDYGLIALVLSGAVIVSLGLAGFALEF